MTTDRPEDEETETAETAETIEETETSETSVVSEMSEVTESAEAASELTGLEALQHQLLLEIAEKTELRRELQTAYQVERELRDEIDVLRGLRAPVGLAGPGRLVERGRSFLSSGGKGAKVKRRLKRAGRRVPGAGRAYRAVKTALRPTRNTK